MKKIIVFAVLLIGTGLVLQGMLAAQGSNVEPGGAEVRAYLKQADYRTWKMWPGTEAFYKGELPHGAMLVTYVNDTAHKAIEGKTGSLPEGSMIVMENYSPEKKLGAIVVMYKVKGYNPEAGDWFWARYLASEKIDGEGKISKCIKCHGDARDNDYIVNHPLK